MSPGGLVEGPGLLRPVQEGDLAPDDQPTWRNELPRRASGLTLGSMKDLSIPEAGLKLLVVTLTTVWLASSASAAPPAHMDRRGATRIAPVPADLTAGLTMLQVPERTMTQPGARKTVGVHVRYVTMPEWLLDVFFDDHPVIHGQSVGAEFVIERGPENALVIEVDYTGLEIPATNWREPGDDPSQARFIDWSGLGLVSADVTYRRTMWLGSRFGLYAGGGLGLGFLVGSGEETPVLPTCDEPVAACAHWEQVGTQPTELMPVMPILHMQTGLEVRLIGPASLRLEAGFRNVAYVGGGFTVEL